ncbi:MAG: hypothetical protein R3Y53_01035 [Bacillota bacterium]
MDLIQEINALNKAKNNTDMRNKINNLLTYDFKMLCLPKIPQTAHILNEEDMVSRYYLYRAYYEEQNFHCDMSPETVNYLISILNKQNIEIERVDDDVLTLKESDSRGPIMLESDTMCEFDTLGNHLLYTIYKWVFSPEFGASCPQQVTLLALNRANPTTTKGAFIYKTFLKELHHIEIQRINAMLNISVIDVLKDLAEYAKLTHTLGNFVLVPNGFNEKRRTSSFIKDYWDLSLMFLPKYSTWYTEHIDNFFFDDWYVKGDLHMLFEGHTIAPPMPDDVNKMHLALKEINRRIRMRGLRIMRFLCDETNTPVVKVLDGLIGGYNVPDTSKKTTLSDYYF